MHGQRSYNPQFGRSPYRPMPPPYQQRPLGPPHFQQGLPSPAMYQHGHPPAPPHQIHHAPPQSYVHSSLPARGSTPVSLMYPTPQQNTQNPHQGHRPMPHPPGTSHEELFQAPPLAQSLPPAPSRSQGQTIYRPPLHPIPQQSGVLHPLQHPLPPSMSNFFTSAQLTSTVHLTGGNPHPPPLAPLRHPPPLPSSPLIQPPPPPPLPSSPSTSKPAVLASNLSCHLNNEYCSSELSVNKLMPSLPANEVIASNQIRPNLFADDHSLNQGGESSIKVGFLAGDGLSSKGSLMFDKLDTEKSCSPMRPLENEPSTQPCQLRVASMSNSPADSDMEMEDDITQVANDLVPSVEGLNHQQDLLLLPKELYPTEFLQGSGNGTLNSSGTVDVDDKCRNRILTKQDSAVETSKKDDVVLGASTEIGSSVLSKDDNAEKKNENLVPSLPKVDKFGRLVREGTSDSNSDDSYYCRRRSRRDRSRSRSWSPLRKRRQRRRSPRKRREQRSRSRSQSPRNCRSRSRSPRNWSRSPRNRRSRSRSPRNRRSRSRSPIVRRGKRRVPNCFDYSRGRCHRGADCRYVHHVYDESRVKRVEQQSAEVLAGLRTCAYEVIKHLSEKVSERAKSRSPDRQPRSNFGVSRDGNADEKREDSLNGGATQSADVNHNGQLIDYHIHNSENNCDFPAPVLATPVIEKETEGPTIVAKETCAEIVGSDTASKYVCDIDNLKAYENASEEKLSEKLVADQKSHSNLSDRLRQSSDALPQKSDSSSVSGSWLRNSSTHSLSRPVMNDTCPDRMQSEHSSSQLPPSSLPFSQDVDISDMKIPETLLSSVQSTAGESFPSYMLPNQQSFFPVQPNSSLTSLQHPRMNPPNDLSVNIGTSASGVSSQCQQGQMLLRKDLGSHTILKPYQTEVSSHSQVGGFQQQGYPPNQSFMHAAFPVHNLPSQKLEDPNLLREHFLTQPPPRSVGRGGAHILAMPSFQELPTSKVPLFSGQSLPPHVLSNSSSNVNPYSQQQQPPSHSSHNPVADSAFHLPGNISSSYRHPSEFVNTNQQLPPSYHHHHHPHTLTFEQPVGSNHNFGVFRQDKDATYGTTAFSLRHAPYDGQSAVSQKASFLPDSARSIGQNFPRSGGDQYDPLFDSVEPYSKFSGKPDHVQNWEATGDSEVIRFSVSGNPLDMEGNKKSKDGGGVASAASSDNEEFGETADAEVGVVENNSPISNPISVEKTSGDIEIDQIKSPGKRKKSRDSKSMRPFKVAIANFVKEVLKPSWRQGNMSKEAFKTIVKKTVDKVSGAMKRNQIPKSQPKIDHYIDSSQRKLTKLVMGYVDKYVKV